MVTLEAILERNNLNRAYKQVKANRGGPGVDGMTVPHQKSKAKCRQRLKAITSRSRGRSLEAYRKELKAFVCGWVNYFAESSMAIFVRSTDEWLRRRIRQIYWKQWKKVRTKFAALRKLGLDDKVAWEWANTRKSYWHTANSWILSTSLTNG